MGIHNLGCYVLEIKPRMDYTEQVSSFCNSSSKNLYLVLLTWISKTVVILIYLKLF
jgi:hypothetical protein